MTWVSSDYLNNAVGSGQVTALGLTGDVLSQFELSARATVTSVLQYAGYADPGATLTEGALATAFLQKMTAAILLRDAYALRVGIELSPQTQEVISHGLSMLDAVYAKKLPIPGLEPGTRDGYGGVKFTSSTTHPRAFNLRGSSF